jgi:hypothetical protein
MIHCFEGGQFIHIRLSEGGLIIVYCVTVQDRQNGAKVMYVCMYVCMYVSIMYVCMRVSLCLCTYRAFLLFIIYL